MYIKCYLPVLRRFKILFVSMKNLLEIYDQIFFIHIGYLLQVSQLPEAKQKTKTKGSEKKKDILRSKHVKDFLSMNCHIKNFSLNLY